MPDPKTLKVGDKVRFISVPKEWSDPKITVHRDDVKFMKAIIARGRPSRIYEVDEYGTPWVAMRLQGLSGLEHHTWGIMEKTGWRKVVPRG